ncbi:putative tRNA modification enzyme [Trypanosoma conorhini]|uniref:Threonylcarbamoyladenosine tRNA methylthiotransferase n=1 Tax=Trypanosoma conorhini TaxID=83891 RepID=A0A3R7PWV4_9TRYP|nr:putative tRNA modification enzyme [Trypanosoma conorhini]RNF26401.1 putative tRNA modification enzyme [Trypanosoma conorhini]
MEAADMEDAFGADAMPLGAAERLAFVNARRRNVPPAQRQDYGDGIPGNATVFVHTFGCGHNVSDGEYMAGLLAQSGYRVTDVFNGADVYLLNSCTVKNPSEEHFISMMNRVRAVGKPLVVAGCVPQADPKNTQWDDVSVIGVRSIDRVAQVVHEALQGHCVRLIGATEQANRKQEPNELPPLDLPKIRRNRFIEIIPINVGCLNHCTYCKTKQARGDLRSWPIDSILSRVRSVLREGVKEIRLTSEDVGAYGIDINTDFVSLLRATVKELQGTDVMLRVGMSNPPYLLRQLDDFAALLKHPNVYEFMHIPIQSGSNRILEAMQREYNVEEFYECVRRIRSVVPNVTLATDIICAFPGEGEEEWRETMEVCAQVRFPVLNITRFYPRRNTPAAAMKQIPTEVAKRRTTELTEFFNSYRTFDHMIGEVHSVALLETAHDKHHLVGHTKGYVQVLVDPQEARVGENVTVVITSTTKYSVRGRVLRGRWERLLARASMSAQQINWKMLAVLASAASASVAVTSVAMYKAAVLRRQRNGV